jgi:hypothetical protein
MTFRGADILADIDKKLLTAVWDKVGKDATIMTHTVGDTSLSELADISGLCGCHIPISEEKLTAESFDDPFRQICWSLTKVCECLESLEITQINRLYASNSSGRFCPEIADVEVTAFIDNLDASLEEDLLQSINTSLRVICSSENIHQDGYSFIFDCGIVTISLSLCYSYSATPDQQRLAVYARLAGVLTDDDLAKHSVANIENLMSVYDFTRKLPWASARLLKLWQLRNLNHPENPFLFETIALTVANGLGSLTLVLERCLERLAEGAGGAAVVDPTNAFNCLSDRVCNWPEISAKAKRALAALRSGARLCDIFPPIKYRGYGA